MTSLQEKKLIEKQIRFSNGGGVLVPLWRCSCPEVFFSRKFKKKKASEKKRKRKKGFNNFGTKAR